MSAPKLPPEQRIYNRDWEEVKTFKFLRVEIPRAKHKSYMVSLRREANRDLGYAQLMALQNARFELKFAPMGDVLFVSIMFREAKRKEI